MLGRRRKPSGYIMGQIKVAGTHRNRTDWTILRVFDRKYYFPIKNNNFSIIFSHELVKYQYSRPTSHLISDCLEGLESGDFSFFNHGVRPKWEAYISFDI